MNFLQIGRISWASVALNIITCFWVGVARKISWTSRRMSEVVAQLLYVYPKVLCDLPI